MGTWIGTAPQSRMRATTCRLCGEIVGGQVRGGVTAGQAFGPLIHTLGIGLQRGKAAAFLAGIPYVEGECLRGDSGGVGRTERDCPLPMRATSHTRTTTAWQSPLPRS